MITLKGKSVFAGISRGEFYFYKKRTLGVKRYEVEDIKEEIKRFIYARQAAIGELSQLYEKAFKEAGEEQAAIFDIHQMMLEDLDYNEAIENIIMDEGVNAEYAVNKAAISFAEIFGMMDDEYMRERATDVKDISARVINILSNGDGGSLTLHKPVIIAAEDLAPSETVQLDKDKVLGFITAEGSSNSHTAILARSMSIPAIINVGEDLSEEYNGKEVILDGFTGNIYIEPTEEVSSRLEKLRLEEVKKKELLKSLKGKETVSIDGKKVNLYANIGNASDLKAVLENDAEGIGLFRSEFLYLENDTFPTEEQQFKIYKEVAEKMEGKKVIIRTLDIGADKQAPYFELPNEENPALGYRAIRICIEQKDIFKTQLRALYRAAAFGNISIMFPMIICVTEVLEIKEVIEEVKRELREEGLEFKEQVEIGIMIETPAAAMISDLLAREVDFFSIGTNDLTQYTLAIDRQNPKLDRFYNPHHKAILRMLKLVAENAHREGKWVGICGELGADLELTESFLAMDFDELSVSPNFILGLRKKIRETKVEDIKESILKDIMN